MMHYNKLKNLATRPLVWLLVQLVARNYRQRIAGLKPDRWYWADKLLLQLGYSTDEHGVVLRWGK